MSEQHSNPVLESLDQLRQRLAEQQAEIAETFAALGGDVERLIDQFSHIPQAAAVAPQPVAVSVAAPAPAATVQRVPARSGALDFLQEQESVEPTESNLETVVFGPAIASSPSLATERAQLIRDLTAGDTAAMTLCGAIMLFRGANAERMPQLLKDIGEAWYAWSPHTADGDDDLRDALCKWLERACAEAGVPNTIELVRPGDRFDAKRHHARQPGVEVVEVAGWVILRDNGKVYTKAAVTVR